MVAPADAFYIVPVIGKLYKQDDMKPLVVTMGEPAGIGGELMLKAWLARKEQNLSPFFVIDDPARLQSIDSKIPLQIISNPEQAVGIFNKALPVLPLSLPAAVMPGMLNSKNGQTVLESIRMAVDLCMRGQTAGMITNPIHKAALYDIGFKHPGHTEFIADLCGRAEVPVMMLVTKDLRVVPLTVHIPLSQVPSQISQQLICNKARIITQALKKDFGIISPRIAVAGLNPHAGEDGKIGQEDRDIIAPAVEILKAEGLMITGPHPADTLFHAEARAKYDVAIGMYHDQALIPLKTLDFHGGVNITLGLSVIRTSPDHGTALDIAGRGIANANSLINAVKMVATIAENRGL